MTEPKKMLKSKLQSRLNKKASTDATTVEAIKGKNQAISQQPIRVDTATVTAAKRPATATATATATAAAKDKNATTTNVQKPTEEKNFTQQLEALISQHGQPTDPAPKAADQTQLQEQQVEAKVPARRSRPIKAKKPKPPKPPLSPEAKRQLYRIMLFYGIATLLMLLDQLTKGLARNVLINESIRVTSWFDLILVFNPGAAFSLLSEGGWQRPFLVGVSLLVSILLIFWLPRAPRHKLVLPLALTCILGGAFGNLIDRALYGYVVDFISFHYQQLRFPTFNVADSVITIGAVLLIIDMVMEEIAKFKAKKHTDLDSKPEHSPIPQHSPMPQQPSQQDHPLNTPPLAEEQWAQEPVRKNR